MTTFKIDENDIKASDVIGLNLLLKQLNPEAPEQDMDGIDDFMKKGLIITLRDVSRGGVLIGIGTIVPVPDLLHLSGNIGSKVVDSEYRGQGLSKNIMKAILQKGKELGMKYAVLSSAPNRVVANKLYQSMGFKKPNTNFYRFYY